MYFIKLTVIKYCAKSGDKNKTRSNFFPKVQSMSFFYSKSNGSIAHCFQFIFVNNAHICFSYEAKQIYPTALNNKHYVLDIYLFWMSRQFSSFLLLLWSFCLTQRYMQWEFTINIALLEYIQVLILRHQFKTSIFYTSI